MENGKIELRMENTCKEDLLRYQEIIFALITCGGLSGVKNGRTIIHFDKDANFMGVELNYWPFRKRDLTRN